MTDLTCAELRELGAELALGILPGQERAAAIDHLDRCPSCREYVEHLTLAEDGLLGLLPGSEPPVGFEKRVLRRLGMAGARSAGRRTSRPESAGRRFSYVRPASRRPADRDSDSQETGATGPAGLDPVGLDPAEPASGGSEPGGSEPGGSEPGGSEPGGSEPGGRGSGSQGSEGRRSGGRGSGGRGASPEHARPGHTPDRTPGHTRPGHARPGPADSREHARHGPASGHRHRRTRRKLRATVVAAILAISFGFGGWAVGQALEGPPAATTAAAGQLLTADFTAGNRHVGKVYAHPGPESWVYMSLDDLDFPHAYGKVSCQFVRDDGSTVTIGSFTLKGDYGHWAAPAPVDPDTLSGARLVGADGMVLATADFDTPGH
ncbi:hypothetical protein ABT112_07155 [Streptomyces sp. NPDC002055]|uniref:hypothetical protein n=1 Tax=Streptomyces sp. NPDC002055 TaxID=3154534 RepID=UPI00332F7166